MTWPSSSEYIHGHHYPDRGGYYDAALRGFVGSPPKSASPPRRSASNALQGVEWEDKHIPRDEVVARSQADAWTPRTDIERLRQLRDSSRQDERDLYRQMSPRHKMSVGAYEEGLRAHVGLGRDLPDGVAAPKDATA